MSATVEARTGMECSNVAGASAYDFLRRMIQNAAEGHEALIRDLIARGIRIERDLASDLEDVANVYLDLSDAVNAVCR